VAGLAAFLVSANLLLAFGAAAIAGFLPFLGVRSHRHIRVFLSYYARFTAPALARESSIGRDG
jgi:hypothetical protein